MRHLCLQLGGLHAAVGIEEVVTEGIEGDGTVHSARIHIDVAHLAGQVLGHRALAARAMAIDCDSDFLHNAYDKLMRIEEVVTWYLP